MRTVIGESFDPCFNMASDAYLLDATDGDAFMLWRNSPSVIIGKNQNAWAEVDLDFIKENGITVARRITGGGAVFHDLGNVNFSFVTAADREARLNFARFASPIIEALADFGVEASLDGRNDITAEGYKISGNAECVARNRYGRDALLHHGTLLFSADLSRLEGALKPDPEKYRGKGIRSARARVRNISELEGYRGPTDVTEFMELILKKIAPGGAERLSRDEICEIEKLRREKFSTWEWNFGASPKFETEIRRRFPFGTVTALFTCDRGTVKAAQIRGDFFGERDVSELEEYLVGQKLEYSSLLKALDEADVGEYIHGATAEDIAKLFAKG